MRNTDNFCFGDIILADYDFSNGSGSKLRPVFVLFSEREDYTILKMTGQTVTGDDVLVIDPDGSNGLKGRTCLRMRKINTFHETLFTKKIGHASEVHKKQVKEYLLSLIRQL